MQSETFWILDDSVSYCNLVERNSVHSVQNKYPSICEHFYSTFTHTQQRPTHHPPENCTDAHVPTVAVPSAATVATAVTRVTAATIANAVAKPQQQGVPAPPVQTGARAGTRAHAPPRVVVHRATRHKHM